MKQPYGNALPVAPTRGDSCFRDDATLHFCFVDGVWTQISGGAGGGAQRIEYGGACVALANQTDMSCPFGLFPPAVNGPAADLFDHPGEYFGKCKFDVYEIQFNTQPGTIVNSWTNQNFASVSAMYAFMLANFTPGAGPNFIDNDAWIKWYDPVDDNADIIDKVYGRNHFYSMLRGYGHYKDTQKSCSNANWAQFPTWFNDLCNQNIGFPPGYTYALGSEQNAIWPNQTHRKMYGLPRPGFRSDLTSIGNRWRYNGLVSAFQPLSAAIPFDNGNFGGAYTVIWCSLDLRSRTSWSWWNSSSKLKNLILDLSYNYSSTVVLYAMQSTIGGPTFPFRSIFVKPCGIDEVGLNWYDTTKYDLYGLYSQKDHSPVIRQLGIDQACASNDFVWLPRMNWDIAQIATKKRLTTKMLGKDPDFAVQFFLRDKTTLKISRPSKARIVLSQRHRYAPFKYEVKG